MIAPAVVAAAVVASEMAAQWMPERHDPFGRPADSG